MTDSASGRPSLRAPSGSCDCHIHIYGARERYPTAPNIRYPPPVATVGQYRGVMQRLALERAVVVQPTAYGTDNTCTLDALAELGEAARGVLLVTPETPRRNIAAWTEQRARAARFFLLPGAILTWDMIEPVAALVADFGWHIQLQLDGRTLADHEARIRRLPCDVVIDHNGKFLEPVGTDHPGMRALLRLLETGRVWVKTSAPYETSRLGAPDYADVGMIARALIATAPERVVWATNWPHGGQQEKPDDATLLDLLLPWAPSERTRQQILVENPRALYFGGQ
jgi:D-galactarolactone isomerase